MAERLISGNVADLPICRLCGNDLPASGTQRSIGVCVWCIADAPRYRRIGQPGYFLTHGDEASTTG